MALTQAAPTKRADGARDETRYCGALAVLTFMYLASTAQDRRFGSISSLSSAKVVQRHAASPWP